MKKSKEKKERVSSFSNCAYAVKKFISVCPVFAMFHVVVMLFGTAVSAYASTNYIRKIVESIENGSSFRQIAHYVIVFSLIQLACMILEDIYWAMNPRLSANFERHFNKELFKKAGNVELKCYENAEFYDKYTRALDGMPQRMQGTWYDLIWSLSQLAKTVYMLMVMFSVDKGIAIFLIPPMIGNFLFGRILNDMEQKRYKENTKFERAAGYVMRVLHLGKYSKEIRLTGIYDLMKEKYRKAVGGTYSVYDRFAFKTGGIYWIKVQFTYTLIFEGLLLYCSYRALVSGTVSLSEMTIMTSVMTSVTWAIIMLSDSVIRIREHALYIQNARDFLAYEEKIPEDAPGLKVPDKFEKIEFKNVSFTYEGADAPSLNGVDLVFEEGRCTALVGENGAGKSTLIKLLLRLYDPDEGEILLNGINIKEFEVKSYREAFAAAFQDHAILAMTVFENLTMGKGGQGDIERANEVLSAVGLSKKISELEKGVDTVMTREFDETGAVFSGGESQKLAVARALFSPGKAAIFDEPSSALDPIAEFDLFGAIMNKCRGKISVIISHRLSSVKAADVIAVIENGKVTETGSHAELMKRGGHYAEMFISQAKSYLASDAEEAAS